jgi:hypothetical protein
MESLSAENLTFSKELKKANKRISKLEATNKMLEGSIRNLPSNSAKGKETEKKVSTDMSVRYRVYNAFWSQLRRGAESVIRPV